jgi:hypothetical protein
VIEAGIPMRICTLVLAPTLFLATVSSYATDTPDAGTAPTPEAERRQYTFAWPFSDDDAMRPRGGAVAGPEVTLAEGPSDGWLALQQPELTALERDRRAILAMAGAYRTTFDFIETVGFTPGHQPARPYQSWATEYVYVVTDEPHFISLQHILVVTLPDGEDGPGEPLVVKHWRQDWRYQDAELHVHVGEGRWQRRVLEPHAVRGTWSQAVYQVDDSPRYQAIGRWVHRGNHATWTSDRTWRPLPRREFSVRDDYDVLVGTNRVTITPRGWVHEEDNLKVVLAAPGVPDTETPYLAREAGLNRYEHIVGYDFSAGDRYWRRTGPFWEQVRLAWADLLNDAERLHIESRVDGRPLFQAMFALADELADRAETEPAAVRQRIHATLDAYVDVSAAPEA